MHLLSNRYQKTHRSKKFYRVKMFCIKTISENADYSNFRNLFILVVAKNYKNWKSWVFFNIMLFRAVFVNKPGLFYSHPRLNKILFEYTTFNIKPSLNTFPTTHWKTNARAGINQYKCTIIYIRYIYFNNAD